MIWVVGARGMLGQDVVGRLAALRLAYVGSDLDCDILSLDALRGFVDRHPVDWIVNCAAYTAVDGAEDEEAKADAINAVGAGNLGRVAAEVGARIIHLSTDYVFDGEAVSPYTEEHPVAPRGAYGRTKARGEVLLAAAAPEHFIVRTAWLYGAHGKNFVFTMLRLMGERDMVSVVDDQHGSPTYTRDLASALCAIIQGDSRAYGVYHYTNEGETTWFDFASAIYERGRARGRVQRPCSLVPIRSEQYPTKAARPKYSVLSKAKIERTFGIRIPVWPDGLERFLCQLDEEGIA